MCLFSSCNRQSLRRSLPALLIFCFGAPGAAAQIDWTTWLPPSIVAPITERISSSAPAPQANDPSDTLWTDDRWQPGFGRPGTDGEVFAVVSDGDDLFIGGDFRKVEGRRFNGVAHWDGQYWHTLGEGLNAGVSGVVFDMAVDGDNLYVAGQFRAVGDLETRNIARFDRRNRTWHSLGEGIGGLPQSSVESLLMFRGELIAAGRFVVAGSTVAVNIARWDGERWHRVGRGMNQVVRALASDGSLLFAGGDFTLAGESEVGKVAVYDPATDQWNDLGTGIDISYYSVSALAVNEDVLCIGGRFDRVADIPALNFALLDRASGNWRVPAGLGVRKYMGGAGLFSPDNFGSIPVRSLLIRDQQLYIGGTFDSVEGVPDAGTIVRYALDADTFSTFPRVSAFTGESYDRSGVFGSGTVSGGTRVLRLAEGNGDTIYIGGSFSVAGPAANVREEPETVLAGNLCSLSGNDTVWSAVGNGGPNGTVRSMLLVGDYLYLTGDFSTVGASVPVNGISRLDMTTGRWHRFGIGLDSALSNNAAPATGKVLGRYREEILLAGDFSRVDGIATGSIVAWNPASESWRSLADDSVGVVYDMVTDSTRLFVVHYRNRRSFLSIYDGDSWQHLPREFSGVAEAVELHDSILYIGGHFHTVDTLELPYLVQWDMRKDEWSPVGAEPDAAVMALQMVDSILYVGGAFDAIGEARYTRVATWNPREGTWGRINPGIFIDPWAAVYTFHKARYGVYIGGSFTARAFGHASNYSRAVVLWDGKQARTLGTGVGMEQGNPEIHSMASTDSTLLVGGLFYYTGRYGVSNLGTWLFPDSAYVPGSDRDDDIGRSIAEMKRRSTTTLGGRSAPEDIYWDDRFSPEANPPGTNGEIFAIAPDERGGLYVAGAFSNVVGLPARGIAYWNGRDWENLDNGIDNGVDGIIFGLKVVGEKVYVGGQFTEAGGTAARNVAVWDRSSRTWDRLGDGIDRTGGSVPFVADIEEHDGLVYVAGNFATAGRGDARSIAVWDGGSWSPLGSGIEGTVTSLEFYGDDLFVGGNFGVAGGMESGNIALWSGSTWRELPFGIESGINRLRLTSDGLIVAMDTDYRLAVIRRNSHSSGYELGQDLTWVHPQFVSSGGEIRDVVAEGPYFHLGGRFSFVPPPSIYSEHRQKVRNVSFAYRDSALGMLWNTMQGGIDGSVNALALSGNRLYVAGLFRNPGGIRAENIAVWDNLFRVWRPLLGAYQLGPITALATHQGEVFAGGPFRYRENPLQVYDDDNYLARLNATGWDLVDGRIQGRILAATSNGDEIIAAGLFLSAARNITVNIARWDSEREEWSALTPGSGVADQEDFSRVSALAADSLNIYVGGLFGVVDTFETPHIARFDRETESWHPLGDGLDKEVMALGVGPGGDLWAGGRFSHSGTKPMRGIARWNGREWTPLGEGIDGDVMTIAFGDGKVYVGGLFDRAGDVDATNVAAWDTATRRWEKLGNGLTWTLLPVVEKLVWQNGKLFAAGFFRLSGADTVYNIARYSDGAWQPLGSGIDFAAFDMVADRGDIYVSGSFEMAGNKPSPWIALWHDPTLSVEEARPSFAGSLLGAPNPTAGELRIRYSLPSPTSGRIVITDATGRDVAVVHDGAMEAGEREILWQRPAGIPDGIYFCRMVTEEGTLLEKVVLVD